MIKLFSEKNKKEILKFAYKNERANMFIIGSFNKPHAFKYNQYFGYYEGNKLIGVAVSFGLWGSFVAFSEKNKIIEELVDFAIDKKMEITSVPVFKKYGDVIVKKLKRHGIKPKKVDEQRVMILTKPNFKDHSTKEVKKGRINDRDELALIHRFFEDLDSSKRLSNKEKKRVRPNEHFLIKIDEKIVSICNLHATSKNYAQLGGVLTLPEYRSKGLATKCVSMFCKKYFEKDFDTIILFTSKENIPAIKVYKKIGFKNAENFIIGRY